MRWTCSQCGQEHEGLPHDWAFPSPTYWDGGRDDEDFLGDDLCRWTDDDGQPGYFIRGILTIPVVDDGDELRYGVWSSLSERSFKRIVDLWDDPARIEEAPYFGWLSNSLPGYPKTLGLPLNVVTRKLDLRPEFLLDPGSDHPLAREQREGINSDRVRKIAELNMHAA